jgi:F-type H+-transporting ATPase subunit delta
VSKAVAATYARALADVLLSGKADAQPAAAVAQLHDFRAMVEASTELKHALLSPAIAPANKRKVIAKLAGAAGIGNTVRNFLYVLASRGRLDQLKPMAEALEEVLDERSGLARVAVTSAVSLHAEQQAELVKELEKLSGRKVRCSWSVDATLIGGVVARMGSKVYDGSVRGRLAALASRIAQ